MKSLLLLPILAIAFSDARADAGCERMALDPEVPAGIDGRYEIVGRDPLTGDGYAGTLAVALGKHSYTLARTIGADTVRGEAWFERCGVDRIMMLVVRYRAEPAIEAVCFHRSDADNYYRVSCRTRQGGSGRSGLEAWFQQE